MSPSRFFPNSISQISSSLHRFFFPKFEERVQQLVAKKTHELQESYEKLKDLDNAKDEFISIASHELRTPMTIIRGYASFLLQEKFGKLTNKQREFLTRISENAETLIELVNDMLDLNKLEAGATLPQMRTVDLSVFLPEIAEEFSLLAKERQILFRTEFYSEDIFVLADPEMLRRVLTNLLGNAFKFTQEKGKITLGAEKGNRKTIKIFVADNGIGIPKNKQLTIFEKFTQVEDSIQRSGTGTGLGLPIAQQMVEKMGGKLRVKSEIKRGSCFSFTLAKRWKKERAEEDFPLSTEHLSEKRLQTKTQK